MFAVDPDNFNRNISDHMNPPMNTSNTNTGQGGVKVPRNGERSRARRSKTKKNKVRRSTMSISSSCDERVSAERPEGHQSHEAF